MQDQTPRPSDQGERPLGQAGRAALALGAASSILLFYLTAAAAVLVFGLLFGIAGIAALGAMRFGLGHVAARMAAPPGRLVRILVRNLWLPSSPTQRLTLRPADAPGLFEAVRALARQLNVRPPRTIYIEMHQGAWVQMRGVRRGSGRTTLGLGFDLLAGLSVSEVEAVLAHELAHAKLVQRGVNRWLTGGLDRLSRVASDVSTCAASYQEANRPSDLASASEQVFGALTRLAARLVASYSRQDEFAADRLAAAVCGAAALRSSLTKLERLHAAVMWLPGSERLARLQPGQRFTEWLVGALAHATAPDASPARHAIDPYSTHPSTSDRIAALAPGGAPVSDTRPGTALLTDPDEVAGRLDAEMQRVVLQLEAKDGRRLARETRKWSKRKYAGPGRMLGAAAIGTGLMLGVMGLVDGFTPDLVSGVFVMPALGVLLYRFTAPRPRWALPVPPYGTLALTRRYAREALHAEQEAIVNELKAATTGGPHRRRLRTLVEHSHRALAQPDYLRAHVASRLALEIQATSIDAALAYAIATAAFGDVRQTRHKLSFVKDRVGLTDGTAKWGAAWAMVMIDDWRAEGLLQQLHDLQPQVATFAALLGYVQLQRKKRHSATRNVEAAAALEPENAAITQLLAHLFLVTGRVADAARHLQRIEGDARADIDTAFLMLRLALLQRDHASAERWADVIRTLDTEGARRTDLGYTFASARLDHHAARAFAEALAAGFTPEGGLGLATIARFRGDHAEARARLLAALRLDQGRLGQDHTWPDLFHQILAQLNALDERRQVCTAWIATVPAGQTLLAERSLLVWATNEASAREHLATIVTAMTEGGPPYDLSQVTWAEAPKHQQPVRPVQPGVRGIVA